MEDFGVFWRILRISRTSCAERRCILRILRIYFENFEDFDDFEDFFEDFSPPKVWRIFTCILRIFRVTHMEPESTI